jgi:hypothetical protein
VTGRARVFGGCCPDGGTELLELLRVTVSVEINLQRVNAFLQRALFGLGGQRLSVGGDRGLLAISGLFRAVRRRTARLWAYVRVGPKCMDRLFAKARRNREDATSSEFARGGWGVVRERDLSVVQVFSPGRVQPNVNGFDGRIIHSYGRRPSTILDKDHPQRA